MKAIYRVALRMIMGFISGIMGIVMKGYGRMEGLMGEGSLHIMMGMYYKAYLRIICI